MARLRTFFDVETRFGNPLPGSDALMQWLHGKAGVIADTRYRFDAALLLRLPAGGRAWLFRRFPGRARRLLLQ